MLERNIRILNTYILLTASHREFFYLTFICQNKFLKYYTNAIYYYFKRHSMFHSYDQSTKAKSEYKMCLTGILYFDKLIIENDGKLENKI